LQPSSEIGKLIRPGGGTKLATKIGKDSVLG